MGNFIAEIVRFINDYQIVVAPIDIRQIDIAGRSAVAREVCMVQNIVIQAVAREDITPIVGLVDRPVISQSLGT